MGASAYIPPNEVIIHDGNAGDFIDHVVDGEVKSRGLRPRNYNTHPVGYLGALARPFDFELIDPSRQESMLADQIAAKSQLSNIRNRGMFGKPIPSRDQNGKGYCWAHSSTSGALIVRAYNNLPYADLSAYAVACVIKNFQDEGGWGAESLEFIGNKGIPTSATWAQQSMSRSNVNETMWADAAKHRFSDWIDGDPSYAKQQMITCLLLGIPVVVDFNWWSHSVLALDLVSLNPFRIRIWNSWGDSWSDNGTGILEGSKAIPDGLIMPRVMSAAA